MQKRCEYKLSKFDYSLEGAIWYSLWLFLPSSAMHKERKIIFIYREREEFGYLHC